MSSPSSSERARRLVAILGRFTAGSRIPLESLAEEVGASPAELAADLETLSLCGVAPYWPDQMVDVFVEDGVIEVYTPLPGLRGSVRLSTREAEALLAALSAAGFSADDPLTTKLMRAAAGLADPAELERTLRTSSAAHATRTFETLAAATREREVVHIAYQAEGASAASERDIEPLRLFAERGAWYLSAWCRQAGGSRTFRIDRIRAARRTGKHFEAGAHARRADAPTAFSADGLPLARVRFEAGESFVSREWPGATVAETLADGALIALVPYAGTDWIARRVVARLGRVHVLEPAEVRTAVAALAREAIAAARS